MTKMQVMDHTGHSTIEISDDPLAKEAVKAPNVKVMTTQEAMAEFDRIIAAGGAAYRMDSPGKGTQIKSFGEAKDAPEVILRPQLVGG